MIDLGEFDGKEVRKTSIAVTNAGDGLSQALKVDPQVLHHGDRVYVVMQCDVTKVRFDPIGDGEDLARVHVLKAGTATIVDKDLVQKHIEAQVERIIAARDEETGARQLPLNGEKPTVEEDHWAGRHKRKRKNCPLCQEAEAEVSPPEPDVPPKARKATKKVAPRKLAAVKP